MSTEIATTILNQIGGKRFSAMTGAKSFVAHADGLSFRLPTGFSEKNGKKTGINACRITLTDRDDYTVEFMGIRGIKVTPKGEYPGVYFDQLQALFEDVTGLATRL